MCILVAHAVFHLFFGGHLEEGAKFFVELRFDALLSEQRSESVCQASQP
jgi:hypothetical protein